MNVGWANANEEIGERNRSRKTGPGLCCLLLVFIPLSTVGMQYYWQLSRSCFGTKLNRECKMTIFTTLPCVCLILMGGNVSCGNNPGSESDAIWMDWEVLMIVTGQYRWSSMVPLFVSFGRGGGDNWGLRTNTIWMLLDLRNDLSPSRVFISFEGNGAVEGTN